MIEKRRKFFISQKNEVNANVITTQELQLRKTPYENVEGKQVSNLETEEQTGFRAKRSTIDHFLCVSQIMEKETSVNQELNLLQVDLKRTCDKIPTKQAM